MSGDVSTSTRVVPRPSVRSTSAEQLISIGNSGSHVLRVELQTPASSGNLSLGLRQDVFMGSAFLLAYGPRLLGHATDLVFDARCLPNPHFVPELKPLSGHDPRVVRYLRSQDDVQETLQRFTDLLSYLLPLYRREGKSYVTVGIGCTGGRHRSVMIANALTRALRREGFDARATHRDVRKANRTRAR